MPISQDVLLNVAVQEAATRPRSGCAGAEETLVKLDLVLRRNVALPANASSMKMRFASACTLDGYYSVLENPVVPCQHHLFWTT